MSDHKATPARSGRKVLHVDDDERILRTVARFLEGAGFVVVSTSSPFIAPIIKQEQPDVIVMDIDMPLLTGDKIVSILRANEFSKLPVIYFSGKPERELEILSARTSQASYVHKNQGLQVLAAKITSVIIS